jgi:hypothetical protein
MMDTIIIMMIKKVMMDTIIIMMIKKVMMDTNNYKSDDGYQ